MDNANVISDRLDCRLNHEKVAKDASDDLFESIEIKIKSYNFFKSTVLDF